MCVVKIKPILKKHKSVIYVTCFEQLYSFFWQLNCLELNETSTCLQGSKLGERVGDILVLWIEDAEHALTETGSEYSKNSSLWLQYFCLVCLFTTVWQWCEPFSKDKSLGVGFWVETTIFILRYSIIADGHFVWCTSCSTSAGKVFWLINGAFMIPIVIYFIILFSQHFFEYIIGLIIKSHKHSS